jgi:hypothetical protein
LNNGLTTQDTLDLKKEIELIKFYRENPVIAAEDLLRVELAVPQQKIFEDMWFKNYVIVSAGRGCGKTYLQATFACLWALLWPGQKIGLLAPSFRQAKLIFAEVDKIWSKAPLLQEATVQKPTRASDRCYLNFKQAGYAAPSMIEAIPLGDGAKIRGARYYCIMADEFAQIPAEIFNTVIRPMGATVAEPMENVKRLRRIEALVKAGKATREEFEEGNANKIIMSSSAYFTFNHMYDILKNYKELELSGDDKYAVHEISYRTMPPGFLDEDNIKNARANMSKIQFNMEYEALWEADSAGIFKASLIEHCRRLGKHTIKLKGEPGKQYVLGVDPARASDGFAMCLIELGQPGQVVRAWEHYNKEFPAMAKEVIDICRDYNVVAVHLDAGAGGGGLALKDLLAEERRFHNDCLLDVDDDTTVGLNGRRMLHLFKPSPQSNADAVYASVNLMENDWISFPQPPQSFSGSIEELEEKELAYETVTKMLRQLMLIEITQSKSGVAHFDVPSGGGHASQKKDLYTAFILAAKKTYDLNMYNQEVKGLLELGIVENIKLPALPTSTNNLSRELDVINSPVNSWAFRKTFKPTGK